LKDTSIQKEEIIDAGESTSAEPDCSKDDRIIKNAEVSLSPTTSLYVPSIVSAEEYIKKDEYSYHINQNDIRNYFSQINEEEIECDIITPIKSSMLDKSDDVQDGKKVHCFFFGPCSSI